MSRARAVVIGAGISGLAAGCYACMNDLDTLLLEQHPRPGGVAAHWTREGFRIDNGPMLVWGHVPGTSLFDIYRELGILPQNIINPLLRMEVVDVASGLSIDMASGLDALESAMKEISSDDVDLIEDLMDATAEFTVERLSAMVASARDGRVAQKSMRELWGSRRTDRFRRGAWALPHSEFLEGFRSDFLRKALDAFQSEQAPAWVMAAKLGLCANHQLGSFDQGMEGLVGSLLRRYDKLGGRIATSTRAESIELEGDRAVGVLTTGNGHHPADLVLSTADAHETSQRLLGHAPPSKELAARLRTWSAGAPRLLATFGVDHPLHEAPPLRILILPKPLKVGTHESHGMAVRQQIVHSSDGEPPKALVQVEVGSDWQFWYKLRALDVKMYEAEKVRVANEILSHLERAHPSLKDAVLMTDVCTPFSTWHHTLNHEGSHVGWKATSVAMRSRPIRKVHGLRNIYLAGQWTDFGWGLAQTLISGKLAVAAACRDRGIKFKATAPAL